jgi:hypothetical protein
VESTLEGYNGAVSLAVKRVSPASVSSGQNVIVGEAPRAEALTCGQLGRVVVVEWRALVTTGRGGRATGTIFAYGQTGTGKTWTVRNPSYDLHVWMSYLDSRCTFSCPKFKSFPTTQEAFASQLYSSRAFPAPQNRFHVNTTSEVLFRELSNQQRWVPDIHAAAARAQDCDVRTELGGGGRDHTDGGVAGQPGGARHHTKRLPVHLCAHRKVQDAAGTPRRFPISWLHGRLGARQV